MLAEDLAGPCYDELRSLRSSLVSMRDAVAGSREGMAGIRCSTNGLLRMTSDLNKAKREVVIQFEAMLLELDNTTRKVTNIVSAINLRLDGSK